MRHYFTWLLAAVTMTITIAAVAASVPIPALAACGSLPAGGGTDTMTASVNSAGTYRVWVRELAPSSSSSSFYLQIPSAALCQVTMGGGSLTPNTWTWVDYASGNSSSIVSATLPTGSDTIELAGVSSGVEIDKVELLTDTSCTPTGDGSNCTQGTTVTPQPSTSSPATGSGAGGGGTAPTTTVVATTGASSSVPTVSGNIDVQPTGLPAGASSVQYYVDGKPVSGPDINTATLSNGKHVVQVTYTNADGKTVSETRTIMVNNHQSLAATLAADVVTHKWEVVAVAFLLLLIPAGVMANGRFHWLNKVKNEVAPPHAPTSAAPRDPGAPVPVINYPDASAATPPATPDKPAPPGPDHPA